MSFIDDLVKATNFMDTELTKLERERALSQAQSRFDQAEKLRLEAKDAGESEVAAREMQEQSARELERRMLATGAPVSQVVQAGKSFGAAEIKSLQERTREAIQKGDADDLTSVQVEALKTGEITSALKESERQRQAKIDAQTRKLNLQDQKELIKLKAQGKPRNLSPLERKQKEINITMGDRARNIFANVQDIIERVNEDGTAEYFGDHEKILEQTMDAIAQDYAKIVDPNSTNRPSEIEGIRNMLFQPGTLAMRDGTAIGIMNNFKDIVAARLQFRAEQTGDDDLAAIVSNMSTKPTPAAKAVARQNNTTKMAGISSAISALNSTNEVLSNRARSLLKKAGYTDTQIDSFKTNR